MELKNCDEKLKELTAKPLCYRSTMINVRAWILLIHLLSEHICPDRWEREEQPQLPFSPTGNLESLVHQLAHVRVVDPADI